jgi:hypothetical protein
VGAYVRLRADEAGTYRPGPVQPWVRAATDPPRLATTLAAHPEVSGNIVAWSKLSRVELWRRTGLRFPEGKLYEDQLVAQRLSTAARAIDVIPDVVVHWRERADGSSITQNKNLLPCSRTTSTPSAAVSPCSTAPASAPPSAPASVSFWRWTSLRSFASRKTARRRLPTHARHVHPRAPRPCGCRVHRTRPRRGTVRSAAELW